MSDITGPACYPSSSTPFDGSSTGNTCEADFVVLADHGFEVRPRDDLLGKMGLFDVASSGQVKQMTRQEIADLARDLKQADIKERIARTAAEPTVYHPGINHNHQPAGRWGDIQKKPGGPWLIEFTCSNSDPKGVLQAAAMKELLGKKTATEHLQWYFKGKGADFNENANLANMMRTDAGVQAKLQAAIPPGQTTGVYTGHLTITQDNYADADFKNAFGEIDRLDFKIDYDAKTIKVWFQDRYEWHPVYPGMYKQMDGDYLRPTNCLHAAAVELKKEGARDYWMKGEATLPLDAIESAANRKDNFAEENAGGAAWFHRQTGL
jgi:hypothetical protein